MAGVGLVPVASVHVGEGGEHEPGEGPVNELNESLGINVFQASAPTAWPDRA